MIIACNNRDRNIKLKLKIKNQKIEQTNHYKYLGLTIQNDLKRDIHMNIFKRKISGNKLNNSSLKSIYYSYIHSQLSYLIPVWGTWPPKYLLNSLQITQNNALRRIFFREYHYNNISTDNIYKNNKIKKIEQLIEYNLALLIHKIKGCNIKTNITINHINERQNYNNGHSNQIITSTYRTAIGRNSIIRSASIIYNKYINIIETNCTLHTYKKNEK